MKKYPHDVGFEPMARELECKGEIVEPPQSYHLLLDVIHLSRGNSMMTNKVGSFWG